MPKRTRLNRSELAYLSTNLDALGFTTYRQYLASELWQERRARYESEHARLCDVCGKFRDVVLHHRTYRHLGGERDHELCFLCPRCQAIVHALNVGLSTGVRLLQAEYDQYGEEGLSPAHLAKPRRPHGLKVLKAEELSDAERARYRLAKPERTDSVAAWSQPRCPAADPQYMHWRRS